MQTLYKENCKRDREGSIINKYELQTSTSSFFKSNKLDSFELSPKSALSKPQCFIEMFLHLSPQPYHQLLATKWQILYLSAKTVGLLKPQRQNPCQKKCI